MKILFFLIICSIWMQFLSSQPIKWYTQGDFKPSFRLQIILKNTLNIERENCPIVIQRKGFPYPDVHEMWITVVDSAFPSSAEPSKELLALQGGHQLREETNGHAIFHQLDDLDQDGIWDELFFQTDLKPYEEKNQSDILSISLSSDDLFFRDLIS